VVAIVGLLLVAALSGLLALLPALGRAGVSAPGRAGGALSVGRARRPELTALAAGSLLLALLVWAIV
jgi:hypothetical protein